MALFDIFRKRKPAVSLPSLCYEIAYFILPHYAHGDFAKLKDMCEQTPSAAGPFFYVMACQTHEIEPDIETAKVFKWHVGEFANGSQYFTLEYPVPPPVDMSDMTTEQVMAARDSIVLAPHFSCAIRCVDDSLSYCVLGQSPIGGGTTLRSVTADGANCNHGPGPNPTLNGFHNYLNQGATLNSE